MTPPTPKRRNAPKPTGQDRPRDPLGLVRRSEPGRVDARPRAIRYDASTRGMRRSEWRAWARMVRGINAGVRRGLSADPRHVNRRTRKALARLIRSGALGDASRGR